MTEAKIVAVLAVMVTMLAIGADVCVLVEPLAAFVLVLVLVAISSIVRAIRDVPSGRGTRVIEPKRNNKEGDHDQNP